MENLKLISVRLLPSTLKSLDELADRHVYYSRSTIINNLLNAILTCADDDVLWRMISTYYPYEKCFRVSFEIDQNLLKERRQQNQTILCEV